VEIWTNIKIYLFVVVCVSCSTRPNIITRNNKLKRVGKADKPLISSVAAAAAAAAVTFKRFGSYVKKLTLRTRLLTRRPVCFFSKLFARRPRRPLRRFVTL